MASGKRRVVVGIFTGLYKLNIAQARIRESIQLILLMALLTGAIVRK